MHRSTRPGTFLGKGHPAPLGSSHPQASASLCESPNSAHRTRPGCPRGQPLSTCLPPANQPLATLLGGGLWAGKGVPWGFGDRGETRTTGGAPFLRPARPPTHPPAVG